jgi:hypothetical protein
MADETESTGSEVAEEGAPEGTAAEETQDPTAKVIEDYRKRQAGAEKARQEAERIKDQALRELEELKSSRKTTKEPADGQGLEELKRELQADYDRKLAEQVAKAQGDALDARFPLARAKFPEVTDTVKLAELEAFYGEPETPKPIGNNPPKGTQTGDKPIEDMTSAELQAAIKRMSRADFGLEPR